MKLCKDCKYYLRVHEIEGAYDKCKYKSLVTETEKSLVTGEITTYYYSLHDCTEERKDSKGLFGLFKDTRRCGVNAVNFETKEEPTPLGAE